MKEVNEPLCVKVAIRGKIDKLPEKYVNGMTVTTCDEEKIKITEDLSVAGDRRYLLWWYPSRPNKYRKIAKARIWETETGDIYWVIKRNQHSQSCTSCTMFLENGMLLEDLVALDEWVDDIRSERPEEADSVDYDGECFDGWSGARLIAQCEGRLVKVWPERMTSDARKYYGLADDADE